VKRTVTIVICTQDLQDSEWFKTKFVLALREFADALEVGGAGNDASETFVARNGVELRAMHSVERIERARRVKQEAVC
jgi:hypothetical protein